MNQSFNHMGKAQETVKYAARAGLHRRANVWATVRPPLLLAVQRIIRCIEIEDDLLGRPRVRLHQQVDQQVLDRHRMWLIYDSASVQACSAPDG